MKEFFENLKIIVLAVVMGMVVIVGLFFLFILIAPEPEFNPDRYGDRYEGTENYGEWNEGMTQEPWTDYDEWQEIGEK